MRFLGFINERELFADVLYEKVKDECAHFLKEVKGSKYEAARGSRKMYGIGKRLVPRKDRNPTDTPPAVHDMADNRFKKKFGWYARSEGVFANSTRKMSIIKHYGPTYYFYPVGKYEYLWSPRTNDLVLYLVDKDILHQDNFGVLPGVMNDDIQAALDKIIPTYKKTGLKDALMDGHEVMYKCKAYYMVSSDYHMSYKELISL